MTIFILTFIIVAILVAGMAIGVLAGRNPIGGSCGGLGRVGLECEAGCDKPCPKRLARLAAQQEAETNTNR
ncbi:MAG TPA: (Na+)-NQR maturation NqrM [Pseudothauera hydrothermalis]|jgi:hypothetical protein|uniref:(Na+)-NQR maturation NqrM n=1 Tax=Pseudothauera hydrothermalis TaxID=2184083 RepID=UPI000C7B67A2|nr:(Na+)-NQR maturation NqrM [Pseudothauera hydrothermalis]AUL99957.1 hypothetical protein B4966_07150 [Rhodocyclaceae bacterium]AVZ79231.1 (Na+)-NQR maturation NqrM [Zoogloeaceae bacteirum Par-f-2]HNQ76713.1 (Na+)-NQR maturation NqrM [Pseudothauera hydrothermalis]